MPLADMCDPEEEKQFMESMVGVDDVSGEPIETSLTVEARQDEMRGFSERGVYHHVPRRVAEADREGKFIRVRWVDVNKGTKEMLKVRSRLVDQRVRPWTTDVMTCMLRPHHWLQPDICCPHAQVGVNMVLQTTAYS